jgi:hypothetical protein
MRKAEYYNGGQSVIGTSCHRDIPVDGTARHRRWLKRRRKRLMPSYGANANGAGS